MCDTNPSDDSVRYLHKRSNGYFYFRRRVPTDLVGIIEAKRLHYSLDTQDRATARRLYPAALADAEHLIAAEREKIKSAARNEQPTALGYRARRKQRSGRALRKSRSFGQLEEREKETLLRNWFSEELRDRESYYRETFAMCSFDERDEVLAELFDIEQSLLDKKPPMRDFLVSREARGILDAADCSPPPELCADGAYRRFYGLVLEGMLKLNRIAVSLVSEGTLPPEHAPAPSTGFFVTSHVSAVEGAQSAVTLDQLIHLFENAPKRKQLREATKRAYTIPFRALREQEGPDKLVCLIKRPQIASVTETLMRLPARATLANPNVPLVKLVADAKAKNLPAADPKTCNLRVQCLSALFNFAVKEQIISQSPAQALEMPIPESEEKVQAFTPEQLTQIFGGSFFTDFIENGNAHLSPKHALLPCSFWAPLLSLFHGARSNEIFQLRVDGIKEREGVLSFQIEGLLKNKHSRRVVPLHPIMEKLGFLRYLENVRTAGHEMLFPDAKKSAKGKFSEWFGRRFHRYLTQIGVKKSKNERFHCFRHTWVTGMRRAKVSKEVRCAIGGWKAGDSLESHYGMQPLPMLLDELAKLEYPDVDLTHLITELP